METRGEQDDDYMSDLFVSEAADICPGLRGTRRTERRTKNVAARRTSLAKKAKPKRKGRLDEQLIQEGLSVPIGEDNIGYSMLLKMGYKPGTSLGKTGCHARISESAIVGYYITYLGSNQVKVD